jgi:hypothetical protein
MEGASIAGYAGSGDPAYRGYNTHTHVEARILEFR